MPLAKTSMLLQLRQFMGFAFLSGLGWLCDFGSFTLLVKLLDVPPFWANFFSSYVGVTFVWFSSLKRVFASTDSSHGRFLFGYWTFQLFSILIYSQLLNMVAFSTRWPDIATALTHQPEIFAKMIVTPFNLVTNFMFMKFLTRFMRQRLA